ncbi:hypothetical protein AMTR_s00076p00173260 [Amborella trichopoda]|uniref:Uncharacterized protein n=1 Tax=Amborella trichopoda TaxID=13333 RepID=W1PAL2_AMBTC|nr:hypothetical protein AMTR_s00076p00173260 [Amborella trichopoda]
MPVQMALRLGPPFSRYNRIKNRGGSANATSAISSSIKFRDVHQVGHSLANVTEVCLVDVTELTG